MATALGFSGEVADFYQRYRRGYPAGILDRIVDEFALTGHDVVLDLGCGTGQLTLPLAERVGAVVGMDPEPDMLLHAKARAPRNTSWMIGSDQDLPALGALIGRRALGAVTIGQALHWMNHEDLFRTARPLIRDGGGIAIVTNGTPLWLQDNPWSEALRGFLEHWLDTELTYACGTDDATQGVYRVSLEKTQYVVRGTQIDYADEITLDQVVGGVCSALPVELLPTRDDRPAFAQRVERAIGPGPFIEEVRVSVLLGRIEQR